jgi:ATP-dependent helicase HepA
VQVVEIFRPGQRWISDSEPELGLGLIVRVDQRKVTAEFKTSAELREYALNNAPLRRVRFRAGDKVRTRDDATFVVRAVATRDDVLFYQGEPGEISEAELSDTITFNEPQERLFAGQVDAPRVFDLRYAALQHQHRWRRSSVRGFAGGRIELIPHQLYIASEVASRLAPRVLLADEVGLGKTIEAGLILHRLIQTGRVQRALILVPESLVHQWFIELLRRFNLWFHIFDEARCEAIEADNPGENPFLDDQFVLTTIKLFTDDDRRRQQALEVGWDILIVDEAHHLGWSPTAVGPEYALVEEFSRRIPGLLLLTATPEQLGIASHFARLRLLDPDRFFDLHDFIAETTRYLEVARAAEQAADNLQDLLDRHGTGRVMFRNTRATIAGFPRRHVHLTPLDPPPAGKGDFEIRADWLAGLLRRLAAEKVLLICRTQALVAMIERGLKERLKSITVAVFHEGLSLLQRDRNAAWFAEPHGARILLCSEIGSEGRNFQFAHHLVLFDLPYDPELIEQRIGRLDRIGQRSEIHIHVPYVRHSAQEALARWHHQGLNVFANNVNGGHELFDRFGRQLHELATSFQEDELFRFIEEVQAARREVARKLHEGRDRLLELNSFRPQAAEQLVGEIQLADQDSALESFMLSVFDEYGLEVEELAPRTYRLGSAGVLAESFPGISGEAFSVTCDRSRALVREDIQFLTWDHPLVAGALDLLLGSEKGNSSFAVWPDKKQAGLYAEAVFVLECIAPLHLHVDRFLPPTPLRILADHAGRPVSVPPGALRPGDVHVLLEQPELRNERIPRLLELAEQLAATEVSRIVDQARRQMAAQLDHEVHRLKELQRVNRSVRNEEIELLIQQQAALDGHLLRARLRFDSLRLICRGNL